MVRLWWKGSGSNSLYQNYCEWFSFSTKPPGEIWFLMNRERFTVQNMGQKKGGVGEQTVKPFFFYSCEPMFLTKDMSQIWSEVKYYADLNWRKQKHLHLTSAQYWQRTFDLCVEVGGEGFLVHRIQYVSSIIFILMVDRSTSIKWCRLVWQVYSLNYIFFSPLFVYL